MNEVQPKKKSKRNTVDDTEKVREERKRSRQVKRRAQSIQRVMDRDKIEAVLPDLVKRIFAVYAEDEREFGETFVLEYSQSYFPGENFPRVGLVINSNGTFTMEEVKTIIAVIEDLGMRGSFGRGREYDEDGRMLDFHIWPNLIAGPYSEAALAQAEAEIVAEAQTALTGSGKPV